MVTKLYDIISRIHLQCPLPHRCDMICMKDCLLWAMCMSDCDDRRAKIMICVEVYLPVNCRVSCPQIVTDLRIKGQRAMVASANEKERLRCCRRCSLTVNCVQLAEFSHLKFCRRIYSCLQRDVHDLSSKCEKTHFARTSQTLRSLVWQSWKLLP